PTALGEAFDTLHPVLRRFHDGAAPRSYAGMAEITRGRSPLASAVATLFGFPGPGREVAVRVEITPTDRGEVWTRVFDGRPMTTEMTLGIAGHVRERFGPLSFELQPGVTDGMLSLPLRRGWLWGVEIPRRLLPLSHAEEYGSGTRFHFDIRLSLPLIGPMVTYRGWLELQEGER
ncbi:MAG: DUF4166 domain-containing protein, partial [Pseudomonadota bacterium]